MTSLLPPFAHPAARSTPRSLAHVAPSLAATLLLGTSALLAQQTTERVSVDNSGVQGNHISYFGEISYDGRYVAFSSVASNLVPGDTNDDEDTFVHDLSTGVTERVSVDSSGNECNFGSGGIVSISKNGRYVAFFSPSSNLVSGDTNGERDVFVHDRQTGVTERVSVDSSGNQGNDGSSLGTISIDGRYVLFVSRATNLVPGDTNGVSDTFVHDRVLGVTERVSVDSSGNQGNGESTSERSPRTATTSCSLATPATWSRATRTAQKTLSSTIE